MSLYLRFEEGPPFEDTKQWVVISKVQGSVLGAVKWFGRQYCFFPGVATIFTSDCLGDIKAFCEQAMAERKSKSGRPRGATP